MACSCSVSLVTVTAIVAANDCDRSILCLPSQDKVHIPGAIYLSIKFDPQCNTEEGCDELAMSSSSDFQQDRHNFSGSQQKWKDFELPGNLKKKKKSRYTDFSFKLLCTFICLFVCLLLLCFFLAVLEVNPLTVAFFPIIYSEVNFK